jgi:hypothetical protein
VFSGVGLPYADPRGPGIRRVYPVDSVRLSRASHIVECLVQSHCVEGGMCTLIRTVQLVSETPSLCSAPFVDLRHPSPFQHVSSFHIIN